jgi:CRISPR type I-E-associated protein CasB/Cse2
MAELAVKRNTDSISDGRDRFKHRIALVLSGYDYDRQCDRVRSAIHGLKSAGVSVDYDRLLHDLWYWNEDIKQSWARAYWR